jgi:hypothetical protein
MLQWLVGRRCCQRSFSEFSVVIIMGSCSKPGELDKKSGSTAIVGTTNLKKCSPVWISLCFQLLSYWNWIWKSMTFSAPLVPCDTWLPKFTCFYCSSNSNFETYELDLSNGIFKFNSGIDWITFYVKREPLNVTQISKSHHSVVDLVSFTSYIKFLSDGVEWSFASIYPVSIHWEDYFFARRVNFGYI